MATTLRTILQAALHWDYYETDGADREYTDRNAIAIPQAFAELTNGTGDQQGNVIIHERRTLTNGQTYSYDLAGGVVDFRGQLKTFARVKTLWVQVLSTANDSLLEVGAGSNPFAAWFGAAGDTLKLGPKALQVIHRPDAAGYVVTAGTGDILKVTASGTVEYDIVIVGADA